jgi:hypothetical protein
MGDPPTEDDIAAAEAALSFRLPDDYRAFLLRENGREYWAGNEIAYVQLYSLDQVLDSFAVGEEYQRRTHPGLVYIGSDGGSEGLAFDTRWPDPPPRTPTSKGAGYRVGGSLLPPAGCSVRSFPRGPSSWSRIPIRASRLARGML